MLVFHALPISIRADAPSRLDGDLLAVPVFDADDFSDLEGLDAATGGEASRLLAAGELAKPFETSIVPLGGGRYAARRLLLIGVGAARPLDADAARKLGAVAVSAGRQRGVPDVVLLLRGLSPAAGVPASEPLRVVQAASEGLVLAQLDTATYKTTGPRLADLTSVTLALPPGTAISDAQRAVERGRLLGEATNQARALANLPPNVLTPAALADAAESLAEGTGLDVDVLGEDRIEAENMGLLLGVARGSAEPPRVIVLSHRPAGAPAAPTLGLVGKGVTFDTGGISIKPADGMDRMKVDMSGGAAVIAAMRAVSLLGVPTRVLGVVPCAENMPGGRALRPGDILTSASGKTVEVVNTDAEGRLVLGDALWYARQLGATHLVDVATLTGACGVALGRHMSGLFAEPEAWGATVRRASELAGDRLWPMPLDDDYFEQLKSDVADMVNSGGRFGGAVTGAMFLKQFVGDAPWAHLDIAATAWIDDPKPWQAKGASGVSVRTLIELALGGLDPAAT